MDVHQEITINNVDIKLEEFIKETTTSITDLNIQFDEVINNINNQINVIDQEIAGPLYQSDVVVTGPSGTGGVLYNSQSSADPVTDSYFIFFNQAYADVPAVMVNLELLDCYNTGDNRLQVVARDISQSGFWLDFITKGDSHHYQAGASWMAVGMAA
jgi:hypothetical protein